MTTDKLIDLVIHMANDKAKEAIKQKLLITDKEQSDIANFWYGQYMAFNEIYSMMKNIKDGQDNNSEIK